VNWNRVRVASAMTARELVRNRIGVALLFILPTLFYTLIVITTGERNVPFELASTGEGLIIASARSEALVFMGLVATAFLSAFLALVLMQKHLQSTRRLVLCGYSAVEIVAARLSVLVVSIALIAGYVGAIGRFFFSPLHPWKVVLGFALVGFVYSCYGLLMGVLWRRELESIIAIILLVNIDVGWLQNPIFYSTSVRKSFPKYLPAWFPTQVSMVGAFTNHQIGMLAVWSLLYGSAFLLVALWIFHIRMRLHRDAN
jgi:hypothetical protein